MNIVRFMVLFTLVVITFSNCSTDFELNSEWKEIAIVYGLLDQSETRQYIRLNKAFLSEENAIEVAGVRDSLYFKNAKVVINEYSGSVAFQKDRFVWDGSKNLIKTIEFQKVEASAIDTLPQKEEGIFANNPYFLYYTDEPLNEDMIYELVVTTDLGAEVTAITPLVKDFNTIYPRPQVQQDDPPDELNIEADSKAIRWKNAGNAYIYDLDIEFKYREAPNNDPDNSVIKTITYPVFNSIKLNSLEISSTSSTLEKDLVSNSLLMFLANRIGTEDAEKFKRSLFNPSFKFTFYAGSRTLDEFTTIANVSESSVSAGSAKPIYTNIENGVGLFGARFKKDVYANVREGGSFKKFVCGDITGPLNFTPSFNGASVTCN